MLLGSSSIAATLNLTPGDGTFKMDGKYRIHLLEEEVEKHPGNLNLKFLLGSQYLDYYMFEKAEKEFTEIIKQQKNYAFCYVGLGNIAMLNEANTKKAFEYYKQALQFDKTNLTVYGYINYALNIEKRFDEAVSILEQAILDNPNQEALLYNLSLNYLMLSESDKAIGTATQLIKLNPLASYYYVLGLASVQKKDWKNAMKTFEQGHNLSPNDRQLLIALAQSLYENRQVNDARDMINQALILYPEDEDIKNKAEEYKQKK